MECLEYVIYGECKAVIVDVKSEDGLLNISSTRAKKNKAITWTKKSPKFFVALIQSQKHCKLVNIRLLAPAKNRFEYILHSLKSLLINKDNIDYMYVPIPVVENDINN